jgi:hypothetical protein
MDPGALPRGWGWARGRPGPGVSLVLIALLVGGGCTLEEHARSAPPVLGEAAVADSLGGPGADDTLSVVVDPDASARVTMDVFREAVRVGDLSLALRLLDEAAIVVDALAGGAGAPAVTTRGELLLELRRRHADGLLLEVADSELRWIGDHVLLATRLRVLRRAEDPENPPDTLGTAAESSLLRPTPEGWRIVHLHRSLDPASGADLPGRGAPAT